MEFRSISWNTNLSICLKWALTCALNCYKFILDKNQEEISIEITILSWLAVVWTEIMRVVKDRKYDTF